MKRVFCFLFLLLALAAGNPAAGIEKKTEEGGDNSVLYKNLDLFTKVLHLVQGDYVEGTNQKKKRRGSGGRSGGCWRLWIPIRSS